MSTPEERMDQHLDELDRAAEQREAEAESDAAWDEDDWDDAYEEGDDLDEDEWDELYGDDQ